MTTIYDECSKDELLQIVYEMQKENKRLRNVIELKDNERIELVKKNKEQQQTIDELQTDLKYRTNENKSLYTDSQQLHKEINQLKEALNRSEAVRFKLIKLLNKQRDMMQRNIDILCKENIMLRHALNEVQNNDNNY